MKKVLYLMMAFAAVTFISCKPEDDNKKDDDKNKTEEARIIADFETVELEWGVSNGCTFEVVDNPSKTGINTSAKVGKYTTAEAEWDFIWSHNLGQTETHPEIDCLDFTKDGYVIKMDVLAPVAGMKIYCKIESKLEKGPAAKEITSVVTTKANEWETLEFDYESMSPETLKYTGFVICVDAGGKTAGTVVYLDNIRQVKGE